MLRSTLSVLQALLPPERALRTILVVDDEPDIRNGIKVILERSIPSVKVVTADSGASGLDVLRRGPVDLIVTDYKMPGINGVEFLHQARALAPLAPCILITAFERELAAELASDDHVSHVFTKPLNPRPLIATCQKILAEGAA